MRANENIPTWRFLGLLSSARCSLKNFQPLSLIAKRWSFGNSDDCIRNFLLRNENIMSLIFFVFLLSTAAVSSFHISPKASSSFSNSHLFAIREERENQDVVVDRLIHRRNFFQSATSISVGLALVTPSRANAEKAFAPGGTLVDYEVGVQVGNIQASKSRKVDNSNVIFNQDYYFKFGTAPQWIDEGNTEFPKTMPFTPSQQRYETVKKYGERVQRGVDRIASLGESIKNGDYNSILDGSAPEYYIRPMGLMANGFLASENTGTTNELLLARWYINEISLDIDDIKNASSKEEATSAYQATIKAVNSYLCLLNRVITPKVGDKLQLLETV